MLPVSSGFLAALASPQAVSIMANVDKAGRRLYTDLPVVGGKITCDASSITRRRLALTLAPRLSTGTYTDMPTLPSTPTEPLGHYGQEISVFWSLHYIGGAVESVPLGVFRIDTVHGSLLGDTAVGVTGVSREAFVADARFLAPTTRTSASALSLIGTLLTEVLGSVEVVTTATVDRRVPTTTWDEDRWAAIDDLAESIGAVVYADPFGRFMIAPAPTVTTRPVWRVQAGPGGVLVSADSTASRDKVRNALVVTGGSTSSDVPPVRAVVIDAGAASPTRYGDPATGAFGMVPRFMSIPSITTAEQATATGLANLAKYLGAAATLDVSSVPNVALECGDVIEVITDPDDPRTARRHVVDAMTIPLSPGGEFTMSTRDVADVSAQVVAA